MIFIVRTSNIVSKTGSCVFGSHFKGRLIEMEGKLDEKRERSKEKE
jgi:hypothetical protein